MVPDNRPSVIPHARQQPIADGIRLGLRNELASFERASSIVSSLGLGAEDSGIGVQGLGGDTGPGDQPPTADGSDNRIECPCLFEELHRGGPLTSDDVRVVIGVDQSGIGPLYDFRSRALPSG